MTLDFRYHKASEPIPEVWKLADSLEGTIHNPPCTREGRNFVLIMREAE